MLPRMDVRLGTDWAAEYARLIADRDEQLTLTAAQGSAFWDRAAAAFPTALNADEDRLLDVLEPWLTPQATVIDVGAGAGRHVRELVGRVDWVTAVEPSEGMRSRIPEAPNLTVIASGWLDADPAPADVVYASFVLNSVADPVAFVRHMEACARSRVAIQDRDSPALFPWDELFERITGTPRRREALATDLYLVLRQLGIEPDVVTFRRPARRAYASREAALEDWRFRLAGIGDEARLAEFAAEVLTDQPDGTVLSEPGEVAVSILHWTPKRG